MNGDRLTTHLQRKQYGDFILTEAVRPALDVPVRPRQGYRIHIYRDRERKFRLPMLTASVSAELLFDTFLTLLEPLGDTLHVVLESSHGQHGDERHEIRRNSIDAPVLASHFCDFEDLLLNDGCTGVSVLSAKRPMEVQFDEHKLLTIYAPSLKPFQRVFRSMGIRKRRVLPLITEAEHLHHSTEARAEEFDQLTCRLGVADFDQVLMDDEMGY